jgi:hypothetical protein
MSQTLEKKLVADPSLYMIQVATERVLNIGVARGRVRGKRGDSL